MSESDWSGHDSSRTRDLVIASNRLPVKLTLDGGEWRRSLSAGGLASALSGLKEESDFLWVGWPGCEVDTRQQDGVREALRRDDLVPVFLDQAQEDHYYHGVCNQALWPLCHYFTDKIEFNQESWIHYVEVNRQFADEIARVSARGARVWIHDFHLMLVPRFLREARPDLTIGFFLHIPFPSSEIYRVLPVREELLEGILGADYIGFHTLDYARHFRAACLRILGLDSEHNVLHVRGRQIGIGAHPIGINLPSFLAALKSPEADESLANLESQYGNRRVILGVERLDYTKGVLLKLQAFERLLAKRPDLAREVTLLQILVPSRLETPEYRELKREIEEYVGRINGIYGAPGVTPVEYMHRNLPIEELAALYRFANVGMVTPVRDGMNLVAQEFVLCQDTAPQATNAHRGILVLSEFAGAAQSLPRALMTNPWDIESTAEALATALEMGSDDRRERMSMMAEVVRKLECGSWAKKFLRQLDKSAASGRALQPRLIADDALAQLVEQFAAAHSRLLFLDYDGTLTEIVRNPEDAAPDRELLGILADLSSSRAVEIHIISGRHRRDLDSWFGHLRVHLAAEHGFAWRSPGESWSEERELDLTWIPNVSKILEDVSDEVPGTRVERKSSAIAWHYRTADPEYGAWRARELLSQLQDDLSQLPVEVVHGHRVIEVRAIGANKSQHVKRTLSQTGVPEFLLCIGDDRTDEDMYRALPAKAVALHVGGVAENARFCIDSPDAVRDILRQLVAADKERPAHVDEDMKGV